MSGGHLLQGRERVGMQMVGGGLDQHLHHGLAVRLSARPKPEGDGIEIRQPPDGLIGERGAAERRDERRKMALILRLFGIEPALDRVILERRYQRADRPVLLSRTEHRELRFRHRATLPCTATGPQGSNLRLSLEGGPTPVTPGGRRGTRGARLRRTGATQGPLIPPLAYT